MKLNIDCHLELKIESESVELQKDVKKKNQEQWNFLSNSHDIPMLSLSPWHFLPPFALLFLSLTAPIHILLLNNFCFPRNFCWMPFFLTALLTAAPRDLLNSAIPSAPWWTDASLRLTYSADSHTHTIINLSFISFNLSFSFRFARFNF